MGYKRRIVHVPFVRTFDVDPKIGRDLVEALTSKSELSGLLNSVIPLLSHVVEDGFTMTPEIVSIIDMYSPIPDVAREWLRENVAEDPNAAIPSSAFYNLFSTHCPVGEHSRSKTVMYMKSMFPSCKPNWPVRWGGDKKVVTSYKGVKIIRESIRKDLTLRGGLHDESYGATKLTD